MRLIGNKTKLLGSIEQALAERGVTSGSFLDVFAGTGAVGRHFRRGGFRVRTNDLLRSSWIRQRAYIELDRYPEFAGVRRLRALRPFAATGSDPAEPLAQLIRFLNALPGRPGLFARQYSEGGPAQRLFFSRQNGARIDAIHAWLTRQRRAERITESEFVLLLTALLEAADRVANISGTYGAFLKRLQASAQEPLTLRAPLLDTTGPRGRAYNEDGNRLVRRLPVDVLYIDPPYNHRQYAKNYHVIEVLAELHLVKDLGAYEREIYGKTGLRAFSDRLSDYCRRSPGRGRQTSPCERAFRDLVASARAEHILVSYSEEGILSRETLGGALAHAAGLDRFDFETDHIEIRHKRFRSDRDHTGRTYRVVENRSKDEVAEWLFYLRKRRKRASPPATKLNPSC